MRDVLAGAEVQRQLVSRDDAVLRGLAPVDLVDGSVGRSRRPEDGTGGQRECEHDGDGSEAFHDHSRDGDVPGIPRRDEPGRAAVEEP